VKNTSSKENTYKYQYLILVRESLVVDTSSSIISPNNSTNTTTTAQTTIHLICVGNTPVRTDANYSFVVSGNCCYYRTSGTCIYLTNLIRYTTLFQHMPIHSNASQLSQTHPNTIQSIQQQTKHWKTLQCIQVKFLDSKNGSRIFSRIQIYSFFSMNVFLPFNTLIPNTFQYIPKHLMYLYTSWLISS